MYRLRRYLMAFHR